MQYIQESLLKGERLLFATRPHRIIFAPSIILLVVAMLLWCYLPAYAPNVKIWGSITFSQIVGGAVLLTALYSLFGATIIYKTSEYAITNKRIVMKMGWIQRSSVELFLPRLESMNIRQSILGRLLDYGTVVVIGTGGTHDYFGYVPSPIKFHKFVQQQIGMLMEQNR